VDYTSIEVPLQSGDVLIMYSDGLPEAKNEKNEEFGFDQTLHYLTQPPTENLSSTDIGLNIKKNDPAVQQLFHEGRHHGSVPENQMIFPSSLSQVANMDSMLSRLLF
jgi:hypothetical protein